MTINSIANINRLVKIYFNVRLRKKSFELINDQNQISQNKSNIKVVIG